MVVQFAATGWLPGVMTKTHAPKIRGLEDGAVAAANAWRPLSPSSETGLHRQFSPEREDGAGGHLPLSFVWL